MAREFIRIEGARQHNLKGLDLKLPLHELIVVTGVSGSGKSSFAFDTVYAEGQRRYVETFSPYARQFLERMDKPRVECIDGIPPAIAVDQTNPVRTSRSTVGTMTELNDHLKLLFARAARLHCRGCGRPVRRDTPETICADLLEHAAAEGTARAQITFPVTIPENFSEEEVRALLVRQGYTRVHRRTGARLEVVQARVRLAPERRAALVEALEAALHYGHGHVAVYPLNEAGEAAPWRYSAQLHCAECDLHYRDPVPNLFSFNSPIGACETCRGFGRVLGIDYALVVPDEERTLAGGAVKPWQSESYRECQTDLMRFARRRGVPTDVAWRALGAEHRRWVLEGEGPWEDGHWYGVKRFFEWLETKAYRMHIRVLLSRYRAYNPCPACAGARLKPDALLWRLGGDAAGASEGYNLHGLVCLPIGRCRDFFAGLRLPAPFDEATDLLLGEIRSRLRYLVEVGLGYLTLDRQSRTLSGGEVQRINLTTALGTSLVNTLFVLDEPSIGLHARDIGRVIGVLKRLRDAGNSLLVVEHDAQVMCAADRILDLGPGPGARGGEAVFFGTPRALLHSRRSLTAQYLSGRRSVVDPDAGASRRARPDAGTLHLLGAGEHNLRDLDVRIPLSRLVCITGVSGSGKSTLVRDVLYNALRKLMGRPADPPGRHRGVTGHEGLADVVLVDQAPIGRTTRSNPASYVGALEPIRKLFAAEPAACERDYSAGTFSFNSGSGRCPTCTGSGYEHVEMQFLSDLYLRCPDCDGRRYRPEVLEVRRRGAGRSASIAEVLEMTVEEARAFFTGEAAVLRALEPLSWVGLDYLALGQPVPTLSGGESQRLKLAGHLARRGGGTRGPTLFLFDEPTTGLHFHDIAVLLRAFERLLTEGHSVVVIEHNLDVIRAADWIIDLGPEGGEAGGRLVCAGTPAEVAACPASHTGAALCTTGSAASQIEAAAGHDTTRRGNGAGAGNSIRIHNAREHNLKGIDLEIPRERFTVITGVSGSGKSTLAFDILFAEGQRRYLESLNAYARQFVQPAARAEVDAVFGIPPTVAIEQRTSRGGRKSTVATITEIHHFLRLLFVKLGVPHCPDCGIAIEAQTPDVIVARILRRRRGRRVRILAPLVTARKGYYTDLAKWARAKGYGQLVVDGAGVPTDPWPRLERFREHDIDLPVATLTVEARGEAELRAAIACALDFGKGVVRVATLRGKDGVPGATTLFSTRRACPGCGRSFPEPDPRLFSYNSRHGWCESCYGTGLVLEGFDEEQTGEEIGWNRRWDGEERPCPACGGRRLRPEALAVLFAGRDIGAYAALSVSGAERAFTALRLHGRAAQIARAPLAEIRTRLAFLREVGLDYLTLDRAAPTLSGGEAQRIRLAAQLGSNLRGVCYVLDEPTIGLHPRDNRRLLDILERLQKKGNTVVVVEHDEETIRRARHVVDLGPGAGVHGGRVVAQGSARALMRNPDSVTGRLLAHPLVHPMRPHRRAVAHRRTGAPALEIEDADLHNLRDLRVRIPLGRLVCVTGVSGSGKSSLLRGVLLENLRRLLARGRRRGAPPRPFGCRTLTGWQALQRVLEVDQTPIGKTPRSCPATYVGVWDAVRRRYAETTEARLRGYGPGRFSFNVAGGRCESCDGQGVKRIEMSFLPDVSVTCETCGGRRFNAETLEVRYRDQNIAEVLAMSAAEAARFFASHPRIRRPLQLMEEVGLGYLTLGQPSPTLSGGEAQRLKLVTELARARPRAAGRAPVGDAHTLYLLDEPTIGLHMADVEKLMRVLHRLVDAGHTVLVIEHNLDVIAEADWVIDLGPEGGDRGGRIVAQGTPEEIAARHRSHTGRILAQFLRSHAPQ